MRIMPMPMPAHPCPGKMRQSSPFSDLFGRLGLARPGPVHHEHHHDHASWLDPAVHRSGDGDGENDKGSMLVEGWKHHVEEMFGGAKKILPIMEGGDVKILPFEEGDDVEGAPRREHHGHGHHDGGRGKHLRPHGGHHWRHKSTSFGSRYVSPPYSRTLTYPIEMLTINTVRLHRAMLHLSPPEAVTLAFVLGAGIGSIMHLIFMVFLISIRRIRGARGMSCAERRQARRERREARRAVKAAKKQGKVRLEGAEHEHQLQHQHEEVLPSYAEGESDRLVEKA